MKLSSELQKFKDSISDQEKMIIAAAWNYWIKEDCLISESKLKIGTKDPDGVEGMLETSPLLLRRESYTERNGERIHGQYVRTELLGLMCLESEWRTLESLLFGAIGEVADSYLIDPDTTSIGLDQIIDIKRFTSSRRRKLIAVIGLLPGWQVYRRKGPDDWVVKFPDDLSRVALELEDPDDYLTAKLEHILQQSKKPEYRPIVLANCAGRVLSDIKELVDEHFADANNLICSIEESLEKDNPEDWSNAVHSCRKLLERLADMVCPPIDQPSTDAKGNEIKLGRRHYKNRLLTFIETSSVSGTNQNLLSSRLKLIEERLEAAFKASTKGSHTTVSSLSEADSCVLNTVLLVGGILSMLPRKPMG